MSQAGCRLLANRSRRACWLLLAGASLLIGAEFYKLSGVRRLDQDLYKTSDGVYVETRYCYHYAYGEDAVLKWEGSYSMGNKVIWEDESTCEVSKLWKE
jgi:hypothetical protein